jgi:uncharacterized protein
MSRSVSVDALRGFALLGIGIVNLPHLALPFSALVGVPGEPVDYLAKIVVSLLFEGKFFVLFSFLFGWGFGVQLASAHRAGRGALAGYRARLLALALFGIGHALLVFHGDILLAYALLGAALWPLRDASPARLVRVALVMLPVAATAYVGLGVLSGMTADFAAQGFDLSGAGYKGGFAQAVAQRLADWPASVIVVALFNGPLAFAGFCLGLAAQKAGFFENGAPARAELMRWVPVLLGLGLVSNAVYAAATVDALSSPVLKLVGYGALALGAPALAAVYVAAILRFTPVLGVLVPLGSMPLSGYIVQGVIAGAIFHGWGLGLFGDLGNGALLGIAVAIWLAVVFLAIIWQRFQSRGPFDAALRALAGVLARIFAR